MASTFTTNTHLELQGTGDNSGTWGSVLNANAFTIVDNVFGGVQTISLSSSNVAINTAQSQNNCIKLTGALTADVIVTFPAIGRTYFIVNSTTGTHTVTIACAGAGTSAVIQQGRNGFFVLDTVNVIALTDSGSPIGMVSAFAMSTVPTNWGECDGAAISRTTYAALFTLVGTTYGAGDGVTTFNKPDLRGYFIRGYDHGRGVDPARVFGSSQTFATSLSGITASFAGVALAGHTHTVTSAGSRHGANGSTYVNWYSSDGNSADNSVVHSLTSSSVSAGTPSGTVTLIGGATETRPYNVAMLMCIRLN